MKLFKRITLIFLIFVICFSLSACGKNTAEAYIYFQLNEKPVSLDPQTASSDCELMIIRNIFEGLLRKNEKGEIVCGVCKDYSKSGLSYTFNLKEDLIWNNGDKLTADDFVFAFRRAVQKKTQSPFVYRLFCIKNAKEIYTNKKSTSELGVKAVNSNTLVITLKTDDKDFPETLTSSICMPCNKKFFNESIGKYGLESEYIISNGSYFLKKWNKEDFGIRLYKNEKYGGSFVAENAAVFISKSEKDTPVEVLQKDTGDMAFLDSSFVSSAKASNIKIKDVPNTLWVLTIGKKFNSQTRKCFAKAFSPKIYKDSLPNGFTLAETIYPSIISSAKDVGKYAITKYDISSAKEIMSNEISSFDGEKFPLSTLYYYDAPGIKQTVTDVVGHWQQNLSTFINIKPSDSLEQMTSQIKNQSLDFAVFPLKATNSSANEFLHKFGESSKSLKEAQKKIVGENRIIPLAFENTNIAYTDSIDLKYCDTSNGYIDFAYIIKHE